jgi:hypothetical protein
MEVCDFMSDDTIRIGKKKSRFLDKVKDILPDAGNLDMCLTCGGCLSLKILGPNERTYLRDDLKDVWVFHPEMAM